MDLSSQQIISLGQQTLLEEAEALKDIAQSIGEEFVVAVERILACRGKLIVTGIGKSGLVGRKIAATLASTGTPSFYLHPSEAFHGDLGMISPEDIILALSFSGETDEVLKIVPFIHSSSNTLISMTRSENSTLAKNSDIHLKVNVNCEACALRLAPTTSTTAQIAMGDALAVALMKARNFTSLDFARLHPGGNLGRRLLMRVENVMRSEDLPMVGRDCSATDLIHEICRGGLGLVVVIQSGQIAGIITDGDVRRAMRSRGKEFFSLVAADIANPSPKTIPYNAKLIDAEQMMTAHNVNALLATDESGSLRGVIRILDIKL